MTALGSTNCAKRSSRLLRLVWNATFRRWTMRRRRAELYVDSLAVVQGFEHQGIATALLKQTIAKAKRMQLPAVGLLVDQGNPKAERLYTHIGFQFVNTSRWGGHPMKHLQYIL